MKTEEILYNNINNQLFTNSIFVFTNLVDFKETYYFTSHIKSVSLIVKCIGEALDLGYDKIFNLILSSFFLSTILTAFPKKYQLIDPNNLESIDLKTSYFEDYSKAVSILAPLDHLKNHSRVLYQVWEHCDGSGLPNGLSFMQLPIEPQILSIANIYHNKVYGINPKDISKIEEGTEITQTLEQTNKRHNDALNYINSKATWFASDIYQVFFDLIRKEKCAALVPYKEMIKVSFNT